MKSRRRNTQRHAAISRRILRLDDHASRRGAGSVLMICSTHGGHDDDTQYTTREFDIIAFADVGSRFAIWPPPDISREASSP